MKTVTINQLQAYSGIKAHTIRIWEKRYDLLQPQRNGCNIRGYTLNQVDVFLDIVFLNKNGYKISRLVGMTEAEIEQKMALLTDGDSLADKALKSLIIAYLKEDLDEIERLVDYCINMHSPALVVKCILLPFVERTDLLWGDYRKFTTIEKVVFEILHRKLLHIIEGNSIHCDSDRTAILAMIPSENNSLSLLFAHYFLAESGTKCIVINEAGIDDLEAVVKKFKTNLIVTTLCRKRNKAIIDEWKAAFAINALPPLLHVLCNTRNEASGYPQPFLLSMEGLICLQQDTLEIC
jgi:DNA-binding transcriptional MerR regulator